jgi:glycine cleavage system H protein
LDSKNCVEVTIDGITYKFREDVYYSADGLWVAVDEDSARVGVADHLYRSISPGLNFIELPRPGTEVKQGEEMGSFDMVKVDMPILSPVSGVIEEVNEELEGNLWLVDSDRYGEGWLTLVHLAEFDSDRRNLLDVDAYRSLLETETKPRAISAEQTLFGLLCKRGQEYSSTARSRSQCPNLMDHWP